MVNIVFESHATTLDNQNHISSGHNDVELSTLGIQQAKELGKRYKNDHFDVVFVSGLQRSFKTAEIAFGNRFPIIRDKRLRECDYGDLTQHPSSEVDPAKVKYISVPFPNGESYEDCLNRIEEFLDELKQKYPDRGTNVLIIGHRATQYGLEYLINGVDLKTLLQTPFKWQPGWLYQLG